MKDDEIPVGLPLELKHFDPVAQVLVVVVLQVAVRKHRKLIFCWTKKVFSNITLKYIMRKPTALASVQAILNLSLVAHYSQL